MRGALVQGAACLGRDQGGARDPEEQKELLILRVTRARAVGSWAAGQRIFNVG